MSKLFHTHTMSSTALGDKSQTIIALAQRMHYKTEKHTRHELANRMGETNKYKLVNKTFACFVMICGIKPWWSGNCIWDWGYTFRMVGCTHVQYWGWSACMYTRRLQRNIAILGIRDIRSYMLSMQHCNKGGGYQWSQSSVQSRWWVGYVLLSEWLQCSLVSYIRPLQCYIGWVGGIRIRRKLGVGRKTAEGKP